MIKIILIHNDLKLIGSLQSKLAPQYEILATDNYKTALRLIKKVPVRSLMAQIPEGKSSREHRDLKKLLKKLNHKKYSGITKILIASEGGDYRVEEFLKLGIAAVVVDVEGVRRWIS